MRGARRRDGAAAAATPSTQKTQKQRSRAPPSVPDRIASTPARPLAPCTSATNIATADTATAANNHSHSRTSAPQFSYLVLAALDAVGVTYISMDHLRKAKKGTASERECLELWKLLHDLVLVVLADFDVDADAMRCMNAPQALDATLYDHEAQQLRMELVRFYLHAWGFGCSAFFDHRVANASVTSADLLLAIAWLVAFGAFFERLRVPILERIVREQPKLFVLPPYPNDAVLTATQRTQAVDTALATALRLVDLHSSDAATFESLIHQLHAAFGRIASVTNELAALERYHLRLLQRVADVQHRHDDDDDLLLPASALQLLAQSRGALERHMQLLTHRVKMLEDEQLFYKWINSLVAVQGVPNASPPATSTVASTDATALLATKFPVIATHVQALETLLRDAAAVHKQVAIAFDAAWRKYRADKRPAQVQRMALSMERKALDVTKRELVDPQTLYLQTAAQQQCAVQAVCSNTDCHMCDNSTDPPQQQQTSASEQSLASLQSQLTRVIAEISTEYCNAELR